MTIPKKPKVISGASEKKLPRQNQRQKQYPKEFFILLDESDRIRVQVVVEKKEVTYLVVQYETMIDAQWLPIVRYDAAHGYFHQDLYQGDKQVSKKEISVADLNEGLTYAQKDLEQHWQQYKNKFLLSLKKKG